MVIDYCNEADFSEVIALAEKCRKVGGTEEVFLNLYIWCYRWEKRISVEFTQY